MENTVLYTIQVSVRLCKSLVAYKDINCMFTLPCMNIVETNIVNACVAIL